MSVFETLSFRIFRRNPALQRKIVIVISGLVLLSLCPLWVLSSLNKFNEARGPFWLGSNSDPTYVYFFNSLLFLCGKTPVHTDHPGTILQVVEAIVLYSWEGVRFAPTVLMKVFKDPEAYLQSSVRTLQIWNLVIVTLVSVGLWQSTRSLVAALLLQWIPFVEYQTYWGMIYLQPEILMPSLCALFFGLILEQYFQPALRHLMIRSTLIGAAGAMLLVNKITALPLLLAPFLCLRSFRAVISYVVSLLLFCSIFLIPVWPRFNHMVAWFARFVTHTGTYGGGQSGFLDKKIFWPSLKAIVVAYESLLPVYFVIGLILVSVFFINRKRKRTFVQSVGLLCVPVAGLVMVAKQPAAHYFIPSSCFLGLLGAWAWLQGRTYLPKLGIGLAAVALLLTLTISFRDFRKASAAVLNQWQQSNPLEEALGLLAANTRRELTRVDYYRASSLAFALEFGNGYSEHVFADYLERIYPNAIFFNIWNYNFHNFHEWIVPDAFFATHSQFTVLGEKSVWKDERIKKVMLSQHAKIRVLKETLDYQWVLVRRPHKRNP
jgi:hypothetical protein